MSYLEVKAGCACDNAVIFYPDFDGDGFGDSGIDPIFICDGSTPANHVLNNMDCDDTNPFDEHMVLSSTLNTSASYKAISTLSASSMVDESAQVVFQAVKSISFGENFEITNGGLLEVMVDSCGTTGM